MRDEAKATCGNEDQQKKRRHTNSSFSCLPCLPACPHVQTNVRVLQIATEAKKSQVKSHPHNKDFASPLAPRVPKKDQKLAGPTPWLLLRDAVVLKGRWPAGCQAKARIFAHSGLGAYHKMQHGLVVSAFRFLIDRRRRVGRR